MSAKLLALKFRSQVSHRVDGIVFQPIHAPYRAGASDATFEWELSSSADKNDRLPENSLLEFISTKAAKEPLKIGFSNPCKKRREV